jgi:hypothetical protein
MRIETLLILLGCFMLAEPAHLIAGEISVTYTDGKVHAVNMAIASMSDGRGDIVWEDEVEVPGVRAMRIHFDQIQDANRGDYEVVFRDIDHQSVGTVSRADFTRHPDYWSDWLPRGYVLILVRRLAPLTPALTFKIDKVVFETRSPKVESVVGKPDFDDPASFDNRLWQAAQSVAKLSFVDGNDSKTCTGFLIGANELLTNAHCVRNESICSSLLAIFGYQYDHSFNVQEGVPYRCDGIVVQPDAEADFVILKIAGEPGNRWGYLKLEDIALHAGDPLIIIQHPSGAIKRVVIKNCEVKTEQAPNEKGALDDFGHVCDTETGSSGSPILNSDYLVVGLHHLGFDREDPRWSNENRGVYSSKILSSMLGNK